MDTMMDLQQAIVREVVDAAAGQDWSVLTATFRGISDTGEIDVEAEMTGGRKQWLRAPQAAMTFLDLRKSMATPEHGTWYVATLKIDKESNNFNFDFDYRSEPAWDLPKSADAWIEDHEMYPRPIGEVPTWHPANRR